MATNKKNDTITNVTGRELDPHGRFDAKYNRPKRFLRTFFTKYFLPSIITAGLAVAAVVAFPIFSTAASLTAANLALVGAGTFAATSCAIGTGTLINNKLGARRRVKRALKKGGETQAALFDSLENEPRFKNGRMYYADNQRRPALKGRTFWRRRDELWQYLKQNRNNTSGRFTNRELVQRIIDNDDTKYVVDLVMLAAKKGYLGEEQKSYANNRANMKALKNLKYMTESEADELLSGMLGIENHMRTEGTNTYNIGPKTRKFRKSDTSLIQEMTEPAVEYGDMTKAQKDALRNALAQAEVEQKQREAMEQLERQQAEAERQRQDNLHASLDEHNAAAPAKTPTFTESLPLVGRMVERELASGEKVFEDAPSSLTSQIIDREQTPVDTTIAYNVPARVPATKTTKSKRKVELVSNLKPEDRVM